MWIEIYTVPLDGPPELVVPHAGDVDRNSFNDGELARLEVVPHAGDVDRNMGLWL